MSWLSRLATTVIAGVLLIAPTFNASASELIQTVGHGEINWSKGTITATGSGAPNLKAANVAVARLGAERAAKMAAFRNIIEAVKGARVQGQQSAGSFMDSAPQIRAQVEGAIRNFKVLDTRYYSDGGVDVVVEAPLGGVLLEKLLPSTGSKAADAKAGADDATGIVVNAKGLNLTPALAPRIVDESGQEIYSAAQVTREAARQHGQVGYSRSLDNALKASRVASRPIVVKALRAAEKGSADVVVSSADAQKIAGLTSLLSAGKVIIVVD